MKPKYPDGTARVCRTVNIEPYKATEHKIIYWFKSWEYPWILRDTGCGFAVCKTTDCWLVMYPEHRCKYRLTLPKE